ncbi:hypothetical protein LR48_Vigan03g232100 [Vigna angularis]|uniref:Membrane-associated kinase regulator n=2 Tax=Phaseolus angularis TaxID=3914 RepID=A0A0L9U8Y6_PHAAN|nr:probable membrane-associated kinase regulator 3 [Vigna angularis]KAG2406002.1 membrane-associated kinase regulator [Vigna angularis]KOM38939.1 hypothetical protein LR48_Vigan03g232100 [Vigna angularis]BAT85649.1 hypothetical protein VIGAN_04322000 [Vigna angularis var. angularis]
MATKREPSVHVDEDYIDIELRSSPNFSYSIHNREFEFQNKEESTTSPADELFYKGKLLPLHLPPRLEMVEKLLQNADATFGFTRSHSSLEESRFLSTNAITPLESCNISPSESRRVSSCETLSSEYQFDWSSEIEGLVSDHHHLPKKQTKHFWLAQRLKASKTYFKSLFGKSGCPDKTFAGDATSKVGAVKKAKCKECQSMEYAKDDARKNRHRNKKPFELFCDNKHRRQRSCMVKNSDVVEDGFTNSSRRSFSGVIQRHYASKASSLSSSSSGSSSSSSSFSLSSAGSYELQLFNRSISAELENSIESAIAHCKKSQEKGGSTNVCSKSAVCGNKELIRSTWVNQRRESAIVKRNDFLI